VTAVSTTRRTGGYASIRAQESEDFGTTLPTTPANPKAYPTLKEEVSDLMNDMLTEAQRHLPKRLNFHD
jgi:hypothetical protein